MTMRGGTGEIRAWITVAGALEEMGCKGASVVDYIPANHAGKPALGGHTGMRTLAPRPRPGPSPKEAHRDRSPESRGWLSPLPQAG